MNDHCSLELGKCKNPLAEAITRFFVKTPAKVGISETGGLSRLFARTQSCCFILWWRWWLSIQKNVWRCVSANIKFIWLINSLSLVIIERRKMWLLIFYMEQIRLFSSSPSGQTIRAYFSLWFPRTLAGYSTQEEKSTPEACLSKIQSEGGDRFYDYCYHFTRPHHHHHRPHSHKFLCLSV